jgi:DNA-binding transcriptional ArsR family regulator
MVNRSSGRLDRVFRALADPTRRELLTRIARVDCTVAELARPFAISAPAVSRHLKILEGAGILQRERAGKYHRFRLNPRPLTDVRATLAQLTGFWLQRLDYLEAYLAKESGKNPGKSDG